MRLHTYNLDLGSFNKTKLDPCHKFLTENWDSKRHLLELFGLFRDCDLNYIFLRKKNFEMSTAQALKYTKLNV